MRDFQLVTSVPKDILRIRHSNIAICIRRDQCLARLTLRELEVGRAAHSGAASVPEHSSQPTVYLMLRECFFMRHNPLSSVTETLAVEAGIRFSRNYEFFYHRSRRANAGPDPFDVGLSYHSISSTWLHLPRRA